jgi:hypothetical protein
MEINASPDRLDLSDVNARLALEKGCRFVIDTDAHATGQLDQLRYGVFQARRAGLTRTDVLNALPWEKFRATLPRRGGSVVKPTKAKAATKAATKPAAKPAAKRAAAPKATASRKQRT